MFVPSRLRLARQRRGLSITSLAKELSVAPRSLSAYENGEYEPPIDVITRLANHLEVAESFFEREVIDPLTPQ